MAKAISGDVRQQLVGAIGKRYQGGTRVEKARILDEFVAVTGYHRKHAIRLLGSTASSARPVRRARHRLYDEAVGQALVVLWEASDRICGKRLKPLLPVLVAALERHGHLCLEENVRAKLLAASAATIDRLLAAPRAVAGRPRTRSREKPAIRASIPVRTFADWSDHRPGFMEADLVSHCGGTAAGSFVHTLTLTDIATGWTECVPIVVREGALIVEALERLRAAMPFPLLGFDTDNGGEFINASVLDFCVHHEIEFTRARPHRKNDQAWVEQKNGSVVRRLVGYRRLEGLAAAEALARLYAASRLFVNFFQPSFKLAEKRRIGARVSKRYCAPETPSARLLKSDVVPEAMKDRLRAVAITLDPLRLLDEIRAVQHQLAGFGSGELLHVAPTHGAELDGFLKSLSTAWQDGEVRPTHREPPVARRDWRTRKDPFESAWPRLLVWLETEPDRTAKELFERLRNESPALYEDGQLRTLQRRLKEWRRAAAQRLVFTASSAALLAEPLRKIGPPLPSASALDLPVRASP